MRNTLKLISIKKHDNRLEFDYEIGGSWEKYFQLSNKMFTEYSCTVETVPDAVAVIPFIGNILPIAWLCDAEIILEELDFDFYSNLDKIKQGYAGMYPMLDFLGKLTAARIVRSQGVPEESRCAVFFSGGADAYTTLLHHIGEKPYLMSLWGADISLGDTKGWEKVSGHIRSAADAYKLNDIYVKTNFREIIKDRALKRLVQKSGDDWWHGFQSGLGMISHAAPAAYQYGMKKLYIASSFPERMKGQYTCASDPTIDNYVNFCGCKTIHDGYELDRQEKIRYLVSKKKEELPINLRVCWEVRGGVIAAAVRNVTGQSWKLSRKAAIPMRLVLYGKRKI